MRLCFSPDNLYFTSDTHFCHEKVIREYGRPFKDVEEMNCKLIENWNSVVSDDDVIFHLGDFCMGTPDDWHRILKQLHGKKYLILGNHEIRYYKDEFAGYFELVTDQMQILVDNQPIYLNHFPFMAYGGARKNVWQLFGHIHLNAAGLGDDAGCRERFFPCQWDVGVDNNDFRPVSYKSLYDILPHRKDYLPKSVL